MGFLTGKKLLITGVISNRSIAYGIAEACHREGAELAFTYSDERFAERLKGFAAQFGSDIVLPMRKFPLATLLEIRLLPLLRRSRKSGAGSMDSFIPSATLLVSQLPAISLKVSLATLFTLRLIFQRIPTRAWPRPSCR